MNSLARSGMGNPVVVGLQEWVIRDSYYGSTGYSEHSGPCFLRRLLFPGHSWLPAWPRDPGQSFWTYCGQPQRVPSRNSKVQTWETLECPVWRHAPQVAGSRLTFLPLPKNLGDELKPYHVPRFGKGRDVLFRE